MTAFLKAELIGPRVWAEAERTAGRLAQKPNGDVSPLASVGGWVTGPECVHHRPNLTLCYFTASDEIALT
jgi:hypothetical protein